ncbi:MAG: hypothetical protein ACKO6E_08395 [Planctomycetota bacterium]
MDKQDGVERVIVTTRAAAEARGAPSQTSHRKPQSRKRWGLGHTWRGLGAARA